MYKQHNKLLELTEKMLNESLSITWSVKPQDFRDAFKVIVGNLR